jgi:hypothetical protein
MKASLKPLSDLLHPLAHLPWRESSESLVDSGALRLSVYPSLVTICERLVAAEEPSFINVVQSFVRPATNCQEAPEEATASRVAQVRNSLLQYLPLISYAIAPKPVDEPSCWAYNPTHALLESGKREQWDHFEAPAIFFTEDLDALWRKATSEEDKTAVLFKGLEVVLQEWAHGLLRHVSLRLLRLNSDLVTIAIWWRDAHQVSWVRPKQGRGISRRGRRGPVGVLVRRQV